MAIVQGTMLYASELTWNGKKGLEGEYQKAINRMGRATLDRRTLLYKQCAICIIPEIHNYLILH